MEEIIVDFQKTVDGLRESLQLRKNKVTRDSALLRFQLCFELAWKAIKVYAKEQAVECVSPRDAFRTAFQLYLVEYDEEWLMMVTDRNSVTHLYKEDFANEVYGRLPKYLGLFEELLANLKKNTRQLAL